MNDFLRILQGQYNPPPSLLVSPGPDWVRAGPWWINRVTRERKAVPGLGPEGAVPDTEVDTTSPFTVDPGDVGRAFVAGIPRAGQAAIGALRWLRDAGPQDVPLVREDGPPPLATERAPVQMPDYLSAASGALGRVAERLGPEDPASISDRPFQAILEGAAGSLPTTAALLASGPAALPAGMAVGGGATYEEALGRGVDRDKAMTAATLAAPAMGLLERLGLNAILGRYGGKASASYLRKAAEAFAGEGMTEGAQELVSIAAEAATGRDFTYEEIRDRVRLAAGSGAVAGGTLAGPSPSLDLRSGTAALMPGDGAPVASTSMTPGGRFAEYLSASRALPEPTFRAKETAEGRMDRDRMESRQLANDYNRVSEAWRRTKGLTRDEANRVLHRYLTSRDERAATDLPVEVQEALNGIRSQLDTLAERVIDKPDLLPDWMKEVYQGNLGQHLRRDYAMFDFADWRDRIRGTDREKVGKDFLREQLRDKVTKEYAAGQQETSLDDYLEQRVEGELGKLVDRDKNPFYLLGGGGLGTLDPSVLTIRKNIPEALRYAMGEIYDPAVLLVKTIERSSRTLHRHEMYEAIREAGLGEVFFEEPQGDAYRELPGERFARSPLGGLHTTPRMAELLDTAFADSHQGTILGFINAVAEAGPTVGSTAGTLRNFFGNAMPLVANGNINPMNVIEGIRVAKAAAFDSKSGWARKEALDLAEHGLASATFDTNSIEASLRGMDKALADKPLRERAANILLAPFGAGKTGYARFRQGAYRMMDTSFKYAAWQSERGKYAEAMGLDRSDPRVKAKAAEIVKQTMQNYDHLPKAAETIRRFPVVGPFISFKVAVAQNAANTMKQTFTELRDANPKVRAIGTRRLAGMMAMVAAPAASAAAAKALFGLEDWDEEDDKGLRRILPPWLRNGTYIPVSFDRDKGTGRVLDFSYADYYGPIREPIMAMLRAGEVGESQLSALRDHVMTDVFGEKLGMGALITAYRGIDDQGKTIRSESGDFATQSMETAIYLADRWAPGDVKAASRLYKAVNDVTEGSRTYELGPELLANLGPRTYSFDARKGVEYAARSFNAELDELSNDLSSKARQRGPLGEVLLKRSAASAPGYLEARYRALRDNIEWATSRAGVPRSEAVFYAEAGKAGKTRLDRALSVSPEDAAAEHLAELGERLLGRREEEMHRDWTEWRRTNPDKTPQQVDRERQRFEDRWAILWSLFYPNQKVAPLGVR